MQFYVAHACGESSPMTSNTANVTIMWDNQFEREHARTYDVITAGKGRGVSKNRLGRTAECGLGRGV